MRTFLAAAAAAVLVSSAAGCGSSSSGSSSTAGTTPSAASSGTTTTAAAAPEPEPVSVAVDRPDEGATVRSSSVRIEGSVAPGNATVSVDGHRAPVKGGRFTKVVRRLDRGENEIIVEASAPGRDSGSTSVTVVRKRSAAEIAAAVAARRERARRRAEAERLRKQQAAATFKAGARRLDYRQLVKDPDRYRGAHVAFSGPILQIRDDGGSGFMLLQTSCDEYDLCDDLVYVEFDRSIRSAADDKVTVYGTITGGEEYDTQAGGSNFVPKVHLRYIDE